ncbi:MAG: hypothetical protein PHY73_05885 [Candidatus Omnitrophica bacterium]|nr:hypothetical protein [Candidatus Omnitrophota bacterium]
MTLLTKKHFVFFVLKATSELDFFVPLIWGIKKRDWDVDVQVIYLSFNKDNILRETQFYSSTLKQLGVREYDLSDILRPAFAILKPLIRRWNRTSLWDTPNTLGGKFQRIFWKIGKKICELFIDLKGHLDCLNPSIVFFPIRSFSAPGVDQFLSYAYEKKKPVVLFPHGTFGSTGFQSLYFGKEEGLPEFCYYWYPFPLEETIDRYPQFHERIQFSSYPGNDASWIDFLKTQHSKQGEHLRVLFVIRKFGRSENAAQTDSTLTADEFKKTLSAVVQAMKQAQAQLVIKPHPQNNYEAVKEIMKEFDYDDWIITYEPIYAESLQADIVLSFGSTTVTIPSLQGKPVILFNDSIAQEFLEWEGSRKVFEGLVYQLNDIYEFQTTFIEVCCLVRDPELLCVYQEKALTYFRNYYSAAAINNCLAFLDKMGERF